MILANPMLTRTQLARLDWPVLGWDGAHALLIGISFFSRASWRNVRFSGNLRLKAHSKNAEASRFFEAFARPALLPFLTSEAATAPSAAHTQSRASRPVRRRAQTLTRERTIPSTRFGASRARNASQRHTVASETRALAAVAVVCFSLTHSAIARLAPGFASVASDSRAASRTADAGAHAGRFRLPTKRRRARVDVP